MPLEWDFVDYVHKKIEKVYNVADNIASYTSGDQSEMHLILLPRNLDITQA